MQTSELLFIFNSRWGEMGRNCVLISVDIQITINTSFCKYEKNGRFFLFISIILSTMRQFEFKILILFNVWSGPYPANPNLLSCPSGATFLILCRVLAYRRYFALNIAYLSKTIIHIESRVDCAFGMQRNYANKLNQCNS